MITPMAVFSLIVFILGLFEGLLLALLVSVTDVIAIKKPRMASIVFYSSLFVFLNVHIAGGAMGVVSLSDYLPLDWFFGNQWHVLWIVMPHLAGLIPSLLFLRRAFEAARLGA